MFNQPNISRDQLIRHIPAMLKGGQNEAAKNLLFKLLLNYPQDEELRQLLRATVADQETLSSAVFIKKLEPYLMSEPNVFLQKAAEGWLYVNSIDAVFINPKLERYSTSKKRGSECKTELAIGSTLFESNILENILKIENIAERWALANALINSEDASITRDDFFNVDSKNLQSELMAVQQGKRLNVVILGAGCIGLALANALKQSFGDKIEILIIENRVSTEHVKKKYERDWLTQLSKGLIKGILDPKVSSILDSFGKRGFIGSTVSLLETLLLVSNRAQGVRFLFSENYDLSFLKKSKTQLVFDASGGRYKPPERSFSQNNTSKVPGDLIYPFPAIKGHGLGYQQFGITHVQDTSAFDLALKKEGNKLIPYKHGKPIKVAMMKLINIPMSLHNSLLEKINTCNHDGLFYLWEGKLKTEINSAMLLINLDSQNHINISSYISEKLPLADFMVPNTIGSLSIDQRIVDVFKFISDSATSSNMDAMQLEPPFIYAPYVRPMTGKFDKIYHKPLIPIGDSIFNGHPKVGNGLGFHLKHVTKVNDAMLYFYG